MVSAPTAWCLGLAHPPAQDLKRLHADLLELLGDSVVTQLKQKGTGLVVGTCSCAPDEARERVRGARHAVARNDRIPDALARPPLSLP